MKNLLSFLIIFLISTFHVFSQELFLDNEKALKNIDDIKIAQFAVSFTTMEGKSADTRSRNNWNGARSYLIVNTVGLTEELMQKITNEAYQDFVNKLKDKNYTVSDYDVEANLSKGMKPYMPKTEPIRENCDHYQAFGKIETTTTYANQKPGICNDLLYMIGHAAKNSGDVPISVSYLINSGYLLANAKKHKDNSFGKIYSSAKVEFLPGVQVFWRSGIDAWEKKNKVGQLKINEHIYVEGPAGELEIDQSSKASGYSKSTLILNVNQEKYYQDALTVLKQANTKLVNAIADVR
jgi:hypothetical protein